MLLLITLLAYFENGRLSRLSGSQQEDLDLTRQSSFIVP